MTTTHTPTPWFLNEAQDFVKGDGRHIAVLFDGTPTSPTVKERKSNAAFIVRACNAHDELLAALKAARDFHDWNESSVSATARQVVVAIAKAEGK
ncbi:hypothetical protein N5C66_03720 [Rhizobium pusense]|uniref:Uncharacterized protein n=1 Tax=Agrobacterium genomosp. 2 str. CFBP 5494 TaxID=1183436 RepID=A0A9W5F260_9HYPH|nr:MULTISPECIES: hypothetical protein [Rhizobium/Agrobacterium group]MDH0908426.1 hypothetical protein [Agrobacterium pusense]MDH1094258.1 hypothetical protein [Agrobacterium pusense]MDH1110840.1 hypothetical protein [Agrobacterium pusense]MDH2192156.1 hypothetical protein [Agrobacterium pusense]CAD7043520.1 hypothetical protein RP007_01034 [Rhizobium sp. P007]